MREAAAVIDRALAAVLGRGVVGRSEREVAFALYGAMLEEGAEAPSFETIVAAGPRGARPHAVPGPDPIPAGTLLVVDLGAVVDGYCSDMTRTVATGPLPGAPGGDLRGLPRGAGGGGRGRPRRHGRGRARRRRPGAHRRGGLR